MPNSPYFFLKKAASSAAFLMRPFIRVKINKVTILCIAFFIVSGCSDEIQKEPLKGVQTTKKQFNKTIHKDLAQGQETTTSQSTSETIEIASHKIFLSPGFTGKESRQSLNFSCDDKIYLVIQFDNYPAKLHQIDISWKDPHGEEREHNQFPYFITGEQAFAWSALKLHRSVGAGMLQWINPAAGMEEFIGEWTVNIKIKDLLDEQIKFEVLC